MNLPKRFDRPKWHYDFVSPPTLPQPVHVPLKIAGGLIFSAWLKLVCGMAVWNAVRYMVGWQIWEPIEIAAAVFWSAVGMLTLKEELEEEADSDE